MGKGKSKKEFTEKIRRVKMLIVDCDGVLTDGSIIYTGDGREIKVFNVRDGHGIKLLERAGIECAVITSRTSSALKKRARELGIKRLKQGALDKLEAYREMLEETGLKAAETAYVGDDLVDMPVMARAGFSAAVSDGVREVKEIADYITLSPGGKGAIREVAEMILKTQGKWQAVTARYHKG